MLLNRLFCKPFIRLCCCLRLAVSFPRQLLTFFEGIPIVVGVFLPVDHGVVGFCRCPECIEFCISLRSNFRLLCTVSFQTPTCERITRFFRIAHFAQLKAFPLLDITGCNRAASLAIKGQPAGCGRWIDVHISRNACPVKSAAVCRFPSNILIVFWNGNCSVLSNASIYNFVGIFCRLFCRHKIDVNRIFVLCPLCKTLDDACFRNGNCTKRYLCSVCRLPAGKVEPGECRVSWRIKRIARFHNLCVAWVFRSFTGIELIRGKFPIIRWCNREKGWVPCQRCHGQ